LELWAEKVVEVETDPWELVVTELEELPEEVVGVGAVGRRLVVLL